MRFALIGFAVLVGLGLAALTVGWEVVVLLRD